MKRDILLKELKFKAVRSSGPGGQHVNKVSTKIELSFDVKNSNGLTDEQKKILDKKLNLTKNGVLKIQCSITRSQYKNKELVIKKFYNLLNAKLSIIKKRLATKVPKKSKIKRLDNKKRMALKKHNRQKPKID